MFPKNSSVNCSIITQLALFVFLVLGLAPRAFAAGRGSFPIQGRLFLGNTFINPSEADSYMASQGLGGFTGVPELGVEITYPVARLLDLGMRYTRKGATQYETGSASATINRGDLRQDTILLLARMPMIRSTFFKFDLFAGLGGSNSTFTVKSASDDGTFSHETPSDTSVPSPNAAAGASIGFGYSSFYLYVEGGYEYDRVEQPKASGTLSRSVSAVDFSGPYVMLGVLFDGISGRKK